MGLSVREGLGGATAVACDWAAQLRGWVKLALEQPRFMLGTQTEAEMLDAAFLSRLAGVVGAAFVAYLLAMWVAMVVWTHRDIAARSSDSGLQLLADALVAVFSLPGLLLYLALRPSETRADAMSRQLEAEALVRDIEVSPACPACGHGIAADFVVCPHCAAELQQTCRCGRPLRASWVLCPYCSTERSAARPAGVRRVAPAPFVAARAGRTMAQPERASAQTERVRLTV